MLKIKNYPLFYQIENFKKNSYKIIKNFKKNKCYKKEKLQKRVLCKHEIKERKNKIDLNEIYLK